MNVKTLCLGILSFQEASGYEIKKLIEEGMFSHFIEASFGSIYPALTQMLNDGLVTVRAEEQSGKPDKKVYAITDLGRTTLASALNVLPDRDKFKSEFLFQILLLNNLPVGLLKTVYDRQIRDLSEELERCQQCPTATSDHAGKRFVNGYGQAVLGAAVAYLCKQRDDIVNQAHQTTREPEQV